MAEVLVVDDERVLRDGIKAVLSCEGFEVRTARDGDEALRKIAEKRPDLVLLDVMMPIMDGYETCREMRRIDRETPIVFLSALESDEDQIAGLRLGANDYVPKAASDALLLARISAAIERADFYSRAEAPTSMTKTEADIYRLLDSGRGRYFSLREIREAICGEGYRVVDAAVRVHVSNMRKKLPSGESIRSMRGLGYALN